MRTAVLTFLGLVLLHNAVSSEAAAKRAGGFFSGAAGVMSRLVDPAIPLIPRKAASGAQTSASSGAVTVAPVATTTPPAPVVVPVGASPVPGSGLANFA